MGKNGENENMNRRPVIRYLIYLLVAAILVAGAALSRYATTLSGTDTARVATFDYEVTVEDKDDNEVDVASDGLATMYATAKLSDADNCLFEEDGVTVVRQIIFTNKSEVAVNAAISGILDMNNADGIAWCLFDENDGFDPLQITSTTTYIEDAITKKLKDFGYPSIPADYSNLINALIDVNKQTIKEWNLNADLDTAVSSTLSNTRTLTIVFWAEHDGVKAYKTDKGINPDANNPITISGLNLRFTVTQID